MLDIGWLSSSVVDRAGKSCKVTEGHLTFALEGCGRILLQRGTNLEKLGTIRSYGKSLPQLMHLSVDSI